jgi:hypothetical protein
MIADMRCDDCGSGMRRNGSRSVGYRRLADGVAEEVSVRSQRWSCGMCTAVAYAGTPALVPGFRVTPDLFEAIALRCVGETTQDVARLHGMDRRTVARIFEAWASDILEHVVLPDRCRISTGPSGVSLVVDPSDGRLLAAFPDMFHPSFAGFAERMANRVVVADHRHVPLLSSKLPGSSVLSLDRESVAERFEAMLPSLVVRARKWMDAEERILLRRILPSLGLRSHERTSEDDRMLDPELLGRTRIGTFVAAVEGFRRIMRTASRLTAETRWTAWAARTGAFFKEVFAPVAEFVSRLGDVVFGEGYGMDVAMAAPAGVPTPLRGEPKERLAARILATSWPRPASSGTSAASATASSRTRGRAEDGSAGRGDAVAHVPYIVEDLPAAMGILRPRN